MAKPSYVALYCRVSTTEQNPAIQENELRAFAKNRGWKVASVFTDKASGASDDRVALKQLMAAARKHEFSIASCLEVRQIRPEPSPSGQRT